MKTFKRNQLLAAAALAVATFTAPAIAHAGNYSSNNAYEDCKKSDTEAQIIGGVLGALAGGVFGSNVAGGGVQDEGTALGAAAGAAAGIAIANKDCKKRNGIYTDRTSDRRYATTRRTPVRTVSYNGNNRGYNQGYNRDYSSHGTYNRGYGYDDRGYGGFRSKRQVRHEIERLKVEADELRRRKYDRRSNPRRLAARLSDIKREIKRLKKIENRFENRQDRRRDYRRDTRRDYGQSSHYHGANICYSDH